MERLCGEPYESPGFPSEPIRGLLDFVWVPVFLSIWGAIKWEQHCEKALTVRRTAIYSLLSSWPGILRMYAELRMYFLAHSSFFNLFFNLFRNLQSFPIAVRIVKKFISYEIITSIPCQDERTTNALSIIISIFRFGVLLAKPKLNLKVCTFSFCRIEKSTCILNPTHFLQTCNMMMMIFIEIWQLKNDLA